MQFSRTHAIVSSLVLACSGLAIYASTLLGSYLQDRNSAPSDVERSLTGNFELEGGGTLDIARLSGRVVVVAAWATWCPSCTQMLVDLARAKERFGHNVEIIAINRAEEAQVVADFRKTYSLPDGITYVIDQNDEYFDTISGRSMPEMIFYTKEGIVAERRIDAPSFDTLMTTLDTLTSQ